MPSYLQLFRQLRKDLTALYEAGEADSIARMLLEEMSGKTYAALLTQDKSPNDTLYQIWQEKSTALIDGAPLQQVMGFAYFLNRKFEVNAHTLIPRPETEELVNWVSDDWKDKSLIRILDVGTGSGCIAISLSLALPGATVTAIDNSAEALEVARSNNHALGASVAFQHMDFLTEKKQLPFFDAVVSNPPYIPISEKEKLDKNVRDFEPDSALFVPDEDPLLFYRHLSEFGQRFPARPVIYCELHRDLAIATEALFRDAGYQTRLRQDLFGNLRMLCAAPPQK